MANSVIPHADLVHEPPRSGDERHTLVTFLDYYRSVFLRKTTALTSTQLTTTVGASSLTLAGLLKHMAGVEAGWFQVVWLDLPEPEPFTDVDWESDPDWEFRTAVDDDPLYLAELFDTVCARSRAIMDAVDDLDQVAAKATRGQPTSMRWILVHMIEEYARHCGHADLIREAIDGVTGD